MWPRSISSLLQWAALAQLPAWALAHSVSELGLHTRWDADAPGPFTPLGHLALVPETQFAVLSHPMFPKHSVRIKKTKFCDPTVG
jgi:hypothetical protein